MKKTTQNHFFWLPTDFMSLEYPAPIIHKELEFLACRQHYEWCKARFFDDMVTGKEIEDAISVKEATQAGKKIKGFEESTWQMVSRPFMYMSNYMKFKRNIELKEKLIATHPRRLIFVDAGKIWGVQVDLGAPYIDDCTKWQGSNALGDILTRLREDFIYDLNEESKSFPKNFRTALVRESHSKKMWRTWYQAEASVNKKGAFCIAEYGGDPNSGEDPKRIELDDGLGFAAAKFIAEGRYIRKVKENLKKLTPNTTSASSMGFR